jgi:hypothetical protein
MANNHKRTVLTVKCNTIRYRLWDRDINCVSYTELDIAYRVEIQTMHIQNTKMMMK